MKLVDLKKNEVLKIVEFEEDCENLKQRLMDLGLSKGIIAQVANESFFGPIEIDIDGRKIAIGRGMAKKIKVKKFECPIL